MIFSRLLSAAAIAFAGLVSAGGTIAAPPLDVYGRLPGIERAAISPSGDRIAMIGVFDEQRRLIVIDKDRRPVFSTPVENHKLSDLRWADEQKIMLRVQKTVPLGVGFTTGRAQLSNMIIISIDGAPPWAIFDRVSGVTGGVRGFYGLARREGRLYGYFGGMTLDRGGGLPSGQPELYQVDLDSRRTTLVAHRTSQGDWRDWIIGGDGKIVATMDFAGLRGDWTIRNAARDIIAKGRAPTGGVDLISLGRAKDSILYFDHDDDGDGHMFEQPLAGGEPSKILQEEDVASQITDKRTRQLIGFVRDGDIPEEHFFDPGREKAMNAARKAFPGLSVDLVDWNDNFNRLILRTSGPGDPSSWWILDLATRRADILGMSYPMSAADVGPMKMFRYKAGDGLDIGAVLTLPVGRAAKNLPVVILPHGGPSARDYPVFDWWAQALASRGYAVLQPNFRGSSNLGESFERAGHGEWGRKMQSDISDGLAALARDGIVDPRRACIAGASYGGYAALAGVTLQQGLYRCAVSVAGVANVAKMVSTDVMESAGNATLIRLLRAEVGRGRDLKLVSPSAFADHADAPVLLIHGVDDLVVPYDQSRDMAAALTRAGKPVELVKLAGEDHDLARSETRLMMLKACLAFIEKHNPPDRPPTAP